MIPMKVDVFHGLMGIQILLNHDLTTIIYRMHVFFFHFSRANTTKSISTGIWIFTRQQPTMTLEWPNESRLSEYIRMFISYSKWWFSIAKWNDQSRCVSRKPAIMEAKGDPYHGLRLALLVHPDKCSEIPEAKAWLDVGMISRRIQ